MNMDLDWLASTFATLKDKFPSDSDYRKHYGWVAVVGTALLGFGKEKHVRQLYTALVNDAAAKGEDEILKAVRKLREALLKASPLVGFPRSINGLGLLRKTIESEAPSIAKTLATDKSLRASVPLSERQQRGRDFFQSIYAQHTERVLADLNNCSGGDLGEFAINCIYGDLVAETSILNAKETALLELVACLTLGAAPQAKGHMYGSRNLGNSGPEIKGAINIVDRIAQTVGVAWDKEEMDFMHKADEWP